MAGDSIDLAADEACSDLSKENCIAVVETRAFLAECIRQSIQESFSSFQVLTFLNTGELRSKLSEISPKLVLLSVEENGREVTNALQFLAQNMAAVPVVVLSGRNDAELARVAIGNGAKGFIPVTTGFKIALEAVRFVLSGGTYVPTDCLFPAMASAGQANALGAAITTRELAIVRAIQQGKSNKIIAYELNMCESTVKVHLRNIMKKMGAKNRTDVAIRAQRSHLPERAAPPSPLTIAA